MKVSTICKSFLSNFVATCKKFSFFEFCKNNQGIDNDGPSNDVDKFKYCSSMMTDVGYGTVRPSKEDCTPQWGNTVFDAKSEGGRVAESTES